MIASAWSSAARIATAPASSSSSPAPPPAAAAPAAPAALSSAAAPGARGGVPGGSVAAGTCISSAAIGLRRSMCESTLRSSGRDAVHSGKGCPGVVEVNFEWV